jgi:hypothetical protein
MADVSVGATSRRRFTRAVRGKRMTANTVMPDAKALL